MSKKKNSDNEWFIIDDLEKFIESSRVLIFDSFGKEEPKNQDDLHLLMSDLSADEVKEMNHVLTQEECLSIAKSFIRAEKNKRTNAIRYIISTKQYMEMLESFNSRMVSNLLNNLVNQGILDTAYDTETNDFIFWVKDEEEKPETD